MKAHALKASVRVVHGKGQAHRLRDLGLVPAVVYGNHKDNALLQVDAKELDKVLRLFGNGGLMDLDIEGDQSRGQSTKTVLIKEVQHDPIGGQVVHLDFQEVAMNERAKVAVPVVVHGEEGRKADMGAVQHFMREVHVSGLPGDLPPRVIVDVAGMHPGEVVRVSDLDLGQGVTPEDPLDEVVITISVPHTDEPNANNSESDEHPMEATSPAVVDGGE